MDCTAAHCDGYSPRCSCTNRTARSRTSGENLLFLLMAPFSQKLEPPQNSVRFILYRPVSVEIESSLDNAVTVWRYCTVNLSSRKSYCTIPWMFLDVARLLWTLKKPRRTDKWGCLSAGIGPMRLFIMKGGQAVLIIKLVVA